MSSNGLKLAKYSVGTGDRFAHQAKAQLQACIQALEQGVEVIPVWNKSNREHTIIGSEPASTRQAADAAVKALDWKLPYFLDADHITLKTFPASSTACDFYTIDVADFIGQPASPADIDTSFMRRQNLLGNHPTRRHTRTHNYYGRRSRTLQRKNISPPSRLPAKSTARSSHAKGEGNFIPEISMDETDSCADSHRTAAHPRRHLR